MSIYIPPNIKVIVEGDNGDVRHSQYLSDFLQKPQLQIQMATYGQTLLDVLLEESYISEDLVLKQIFTRDPQADATRLIGSIAEALVVKLCNTYPEVNRTLGMYARLGQRPHKSLDSYVAVATGSMRSKNHFRQHYNPSDTQRDIIWVEKDNSENQLLCIRSGSSLSAKPAGLQVKASHNGLSYVLPTIQNYHYPVLYFDLDGDWGEVQKAVYERHPSATLINPDEIQHEIKHILRGYFDIIVAVIRNEISLEQVIEESRHNGESVFSTGIDGGAVTRDSKLILPSNLR